MSLSLLAVMTVVVMALAVSSSSAAPPAIAQLGFVRGWSIYVATSDARNEHVVLRGKANHYYRNPAWSRTGRLAVTEVYVPDEGNDSVGVFVIRAGKDAIYLDAAAYEDWATWAPDGRRVALIGLNYGIGGTLYSSNAVTGNSKPVERHPSPDDVQRNPAWSPNGRFIAYAEQVGPNFRLFVVKPDGTDRATVGNKHGARNPSWSADSRRLVFDDGRDIYVIDADGSGLRRLTTSPQNELDPAWSPDGRRIAYQRGSSIWLMNIDGSHARSVIRNASQPAWKAG